MSVVLLASRSRIQRGRRTQALVAQWFQRHGWPRAYSTPASVPGKDVRETPGLSIEVKATTANQVVSALKQAQDNAAEADLPIVVWRRNGQGEQAGEYLAVLTLDDLTQLLQLAGLSDPRGE